ncbi:hypothetical protein [Microbacterium sp.]|uniref:hypothetical protein n=1 Tax=Microbacterium sp. TaxID=51671 RepID=UPI0026342C17|nr:hypothetical protein [Microbacterium sp.]
MDDMNKRELAELLQRKLDAQENVRATLDAAHAAEAEARAAQRAYQNAINELEEADAALNDAVARVAGDAA